MSGEGRGAGQNGGGRGALMVVGAPGAALGGGGRGSPTGSQIRPHPLPGGSEQIRSHPLPGGNRRMPRGGERQESGAGRGRNGAGRERSTVPGYRGGEGPGAASQQQQFVYPQGTGGYQPYNPQGMQAGTQTALANIPFQYGAEVPAPNHGIGGPPINHQHQLQIQYQMQMQAMQQHALYYQARPQGQHHQRPQAHYYYPQPQGMHPMQQMHPQHMPPHMGYQYQPQVYQPQAPRQVCLVHPTVMKAHNLDMAPQHLQPRGRGRGRQAMFLPGVPRPANALPFWYPDGYHPPPPKDPRRPSRDAAPCSDGRGRSSSRPAENSRDEP